jgi:hypothetical protein
MQRSCSSRRACSSATPTSSRTRCGGRTCGYVHIISVWGEVFVHAVVLFCAVLCVRLRTKFLSLCGELCTACVVCTVYEGTWHAASTLCTRCVRCVRVRTREKCTPCVLCTCCSMGSSYRVCACTLTGYGGCCKRGVVYRCPTVCVPYLYQRC